jgi:hypothetical protein
VYFLPKISTDLLSYLSVLNSYILENIEIDILFSKTADPIEERMCPIRYEAQHPITAVDIEILP